jgi:hypothetical protein
LEPGLIIKPNDSVGEKKENSMRRILPLIFIVLLLTGCSDSDDDSASAIGGSGSADCQSIAGPYDLGDGTSMQMRPDCTFTIRTPDGVGNGRISRLTDEFISMDIMITQGAGAGSCATVNMWVKDGVITKVEFKEYCN